MVDSNYWKERAKQMAANILSDDVKQKRLDVCASCSHLTKANRCDVCNCFMEIKTKFRNVKCPLDKW